MASQLDFDEGAHDRREPQRACSVGETLLMIGLFVAGHGIRDPCDLNKGGTGDRRGLRIELV